MFSDLKIFLLISLLHLHPLFSSRKEDEMIDKRFFFTLRMQSNLITTYCQTLSFIFTLTSVLNEVMTLLIVTVIFQESQYLISSSVDCWFSDNISFWCHRYDCCSDQLCMSSENILCCSKYSSWMTKSFTQIRYVNSRQLTWHDRKCIMICFWLKITSIFKYFMKMAI